jgi:hypothetical protein
LSKILTLFSLIIRPWQFFVLFLHEQDFNFGSGQISILPDSLESYSLEIIDSVRLDATKEVILIVFKTD